MPESECGVYKKLKDRENRAHAAWTSYLFRNEVKPKLSEKAKRKHQKEEMEAYQQAHKARLAHAKACPTCNKRSAGAPGGDARLSTSKLD
jgi:DNA repair exonuclease SbcCD ATPase subunit